MSEEALSNTSRLVFGLVGAGVIAAGAVFVAVGSQPDTGGSTRYTATFGRAGQGLDPGKSDVKIRGITVGTVESVQLDQTGKVAVRLRVDKGVKIADTASARIEPVSVFGPKDLALDLGAHEVNGPYLRDGGTIAQTKDPQELSDTAWPAYRLTKAINPQEVATIVRTFGAGLSGQGPALRRTIDNGGEVIDAAHANRAVIQGLINDIGLLGGTLGDKGGTWTTFTRDFNQLAPALNGRPDKVSQLLDQSGELADRVGTFADQHGGNLGSFIDGASDAARVMARERRNVPVLLDSLNGFFGLLGQIIRVPGPEGSLLAQARTSLPLDLCGIFVDVCPQRPAKTAFDQRTNPNADNGRARTGGRP
ncbi:MlaD family protein [Actinomadura rudentiformis]|uniref:MCE family protein n=1 Tax=Actinomadura rudentiformis TaxID=359158 RepID=A0A6H9YZV3_9ACTN|nr:MlaD family protein [Actinomadura rudentiformis]KAB2346103.1 MCE family protein [Actinomadura rudentiformis]